MRNLITSQRRNQKENYKVSNSQNKPKFKVRRYCNNKDNDDDNKIIIL